MNRQQRRAAEALRRKGGMHDAKTVDLPILNVELPRAMADGLKDGDVVRLDGGKQRYIVKVVNVGYVSGQDLANKVAAETRGVRININLGDL